MPVNTRTTDTYEYRKEVKRPRVQVKLIEIGECPEATIFKELKTPVNGRLYHSTDTNRFFYDFNNKRYELNLFDEKGGGEVIDYSKFAKKTDIPKKVSQLSNDAGYLTVTTLSNFLKNNSYVDSDMLTRSISNLVKKSVFDTLSANVGKLSAIISSMGEDLEDIKSQLEELMSESDYSDEIADLLRRVSELEDIDSWEEFQRE